MADIDNVVMTVTTVERRMMREARPIPAWPVTQLRRINNITPQILRRQRIWSNTLTLHTLTLHTHQHSSYPAKLPWFLWFVWLVFLPELPLLGWWWWRLCPFCLCHTRQRLTNNKSSSIHTTHTLTSSTPPLSTASLRPSRRWSRVGRGFMSPVPDDCR